MIRFLSALVVAAGLLAACAPTTSVGPDGRPTQKAYRIGAGDKSKIQFRMLDAINALRNNAGLASVKLESRLNAAAATHSRDMSVQNRPWHFGSDGSSPLERIKRVNYSGALVGEVISETYETELETLGAWMGQPDTRRIIMSRNATEIGFSWYQESNGKIWWTLVVGSRVTG